MSVIYNRIKTTACALLLVFAALVFSTSVVVVSTSAVEAAVVKRIEVVGNARMDADTVASYLTIKPGKSFNSSSVDSSVKRLFGTGLFRDVSIYQRGSVLVVEVDENPTVNEVFFKGNKRLKEPALRSSVETSSRSIFSEEMVLSDVEAISNAYSRVGREDAGVSYEIIELSNNRVNVVFVLNEGDKTKISSIQFIGNQAMSDMRLADVIKTKKSNFLSFIRTDDIYDPAKIQADEELLRRHYYNNGYADFQLLSTVADLDPGNNEYIITFSVDEGTLYTFGDITIESTIAGLSAEELYGDLKIRSGKSYSARNVEKTLQNLTNAVAARGFPFVEVVPRGDRNFQTGKIDIMFLVDEGPRVYIERIEVLGNDRTRDHVIRREFDLSEGDAFSQVRVQTTKRRLEALGFFDRVEISTRPGSAPDKVVVIVEVLDKATGEFSIGGGYSTGDGPIGNISFSEKNFLGRGQYFAITGGFGEDDQEYRLAFTEPYFLGYKISAGFDILQTNSEASDTRAYAQDGISGTVRFGIPITDNLNSSVYYRFSSNNVTIASSLLDPATQGDMLGEISAAIAPWAGDWVSSAIGYSLVFSNLDNPRAPREGIRASLTQEWAGAGGDANYLKTDAAIAAYVPLSQEADIVGFARVRGGHIQNFGSSYRVLDNYFQGSSAIRGFDSLGFGPRDPNTGDALGGMTYFNATAELQFPLPFVPQSAGLRAAVFADAGTLYGIDATSTALVAANGGDMSSVTDGSIRASVGVSVIWDSPFGPIRFDYAEPLMSKPWDKTRNFNFGASTSF